MTANAALHQAAISPPQYAAIAVDQSLDMDLTYSIPPEFLPVLRVGSRVRVPLGRGNRAVNGTVLEITDQAPVFKSDPTLADKPVPKPIEPENRQEALWNVAEPELKQPAPAERMKSILTVYPEIDPVPADLLEMARWISRYYCCPLGMVLSTIVRRRVGSRGLRTRFSPPTPCIWPV